MGNDYLVAGLDDVGDMPARIRSGDKLVGKRTPVLRPNQGVAADGEDGYGFHGDIQVTTPVGRIKPTESP